MMVLRPSPEDLIKMLVDDELVALDLLLERLPTKEQERRDNVNGPAVADLGDADQETFAKMVPNAVRRGVVVTISRQLRQLGVTIRPRAESAP
jgi:ABC-type iron transport system FetAB permease component